LFRLIHGLCALGRLRGRRTVFAGAGAGRRLALAFLPFAVLGRLPFGRCLFFARFPVRAGFVLPLVRGLPVLVRALLPIPLLARRLPILVPALLLLAVFALSLLLLRLLLAPAFDLLFHQLLVVPRV